MKPPSRHLSAIVLVALGGTVLPFVGAAAPAGAGGAPTLESAPGAAIPLLAGSGTIETYVAPLVESGESGIASGDAGLTSGDVSTESATIVVNYDANFDNFPPAKVAFQRAIDLWEQLIVSPVTIEIDAEFKSLGAGVLASAGPDTIYAELSPGPPNCLPLLDTWYPAALGNALCGTDHSPLDPEGGVSFNLAFPDYYYGLDGLPGNGKYDFVTVALHEIGHVLGFLGSMNVSGSAGTWGNFGGDCGNTCPLVYDTFADDGSGTPLLSYTRGSGLLGTALKGGAGGVFFDGTSTTAANGGTPAALWAPPSWSPGSSFSHLDDVVYPQGDPNSLMTPQVNDGEAILSPGPVALAIFDDMGWELPVAPDAPTDVTAVAGSNAAKVRVVPPVDDGGSAITSYTVTASPGGATSSGPTPDVWIAGLDNDTPYTFTVTATNAFGTSPVSAPSVDPVTPMLHGFHAIEPVRILDTRFGTSASCPTCQAIVGARGPQSNTQVQITEVNGVPDVPAGADAVVMNVTVTQPSTAGFLTVWPTGAMPNASNLNFAAGQTVPNLVTVKLHSDGSVRLGNSIGNAASGTVHAIFDVVGYFTGDGTGAEYEPLQPLRILDTRFGGPNFSCPSCQPLVGARGPQSNTKIEITDFSSVPVGADAVVLNVTATQPSKAGFLTVWPTGPMPNASNLNYVAGQTVANLVTVKLHTDGSVRLGNSIGNAASGSVHVIFDLVGYYGAASTQGGLNADTPTRILDTRFGTSTSCPTCQPIVGARGSQSQTTVQVAGEGGVPSSGVSAVVLNVTATQPTKAGFLTVWPTGTMPNASNINFPAGKTVPNLVIVKLHSNGTVQLGNSIGNAASGTVHVIFDVVAWFADTP